MGIILVRREKEMVEPQSGACILCEIMLSHLLETVRDRMFASLANSYVEIPPPSVTVLGGGTSPFGTKLHRHLYVLCSPWV